jgi:acyl-CoA dehydrogenase
MAARDIRALPKLEGTVHVNIALIVKFMKNYFMPSGSMPEVGQRSDASNDDFLFDQGPTKGLGNITFGNYAEAFSQFDLPNVNLFVEQIDTFKMMLATRPPTPEQVRDTDWLLAVGEMFTLVVYAQLLLENAEIYGIESDLVDEMFDVLVRDMSSFAVDLHAKAGTTQAQGDLCLAMIAKPASDPDRYQRVWTDHVYALADAYTMTP